MKIKLIELFEELKTNKHKNISVFIMETQQMVKGILKNVEMDTENNENKFLKLSFKENNENNEEELKKYSCKGKGDKSNNKDRIIFILKNIEKFNVLERTELKDKILYRLGEKNEEYGIIIY